jgi:glycosyltransferase involved in cell wall biosynthesis
MSNYPPVAVMLPIFNEAGAIEECLASLAAQDYPGAWSLIVAEGGSTDGTQQILEEWRGRLPGLTVIDNPLQLQSHGLNRAAEAATTELLVRVDAHSSYAPDYLRRSVEALLSSEAVAAGGGLRPEGRSPFGRSVALAMTSPLAIGPGRFHHSVEREPADTVYLGAFRRQDFMVIGGYRAFPSGVAEDPDLYFRWRQQGRLVLLDPAIRSTYRPRETPRSLARQFRRYGFGKADMLYINGRWPSWRPLAPLALVVGLVVTVPLAAVGRLGWVFWALLGSWLAALAAEMIRFARAPGEWLRSIAAAAIMHLSYGVGLLHGLLRRPASVRASVVHHPPLSG